MNETKGALGRCESCEQRQADHEVTLGGVVFAVCADCTPAPVAVSS